MMFVDGQVFVESKALLCYVAVKAGLFSFEPMRLMQMMQLMCYIDSVLHQVIGLAREGNAKKARLAEVAPSLLGSLETLAKHKDKSVELDMADLHLFAFLFSLRAHLLARGVADLAKLLAKFPHTLELFRKVQSHPRVIEYYSPLCLRCFQTHP